jgi:hypothetical protein
VSKKTTSPRRPPEQVGRAARRRDQRRPVPALSRSVCRPARGGEKRWRRSRREWEWEQSRVQGKRGHDEPRARDRQGPGHATLCSASAGPPVWGGDPSLLLLESGTVTMVEWSGVEEQGRAQGRARARASALYCSAARLVSERGQRHGWQAGRQAGEEGIEGAACSCRPACTTGQILSIFCYSVRAMIKHTQQPIFVRVVIKSITQMRPVGRVCIGIFFVLSVSWYSSHHPAAVQCSFRKWSLSD